ncbi:MAG: hypothetical protein ABFC57_01810 [Veillonellales bacterium]
MSTANTHEAFSLWPQLVCLLQPPPFNNNPPAAEGQKEAYKRQSVYKPLCFSSKLNKIFN